MEKRHLAAHIFDKYAERYQEKYMEIPLYHEGLVQFCQTVKAGSTKVLDIGCGPGNVSRFLLQQRPELQILGIDLAPKMVALAKINNPTAQFQVMDALDIGQLENSFAGIVIGFCLPYLSREEARELIQQAYQRLEPEGVFYLSTMEDDYEKSDWKGPSSGGEDRLYMYYHEGDVLKADLEAAGFIDIALTRQEFKQDDGSITWDLVILARKN